MIGKVIHPKTKQQLIEALQKASVRSVEVLEGEALRRLPSKAELTRANVTVVLLKV